MLQKRTIVRNVKLEKESKRLIYSLNSETRPYSEVFIPEAMRISHFTSFYRRCFSSDAIVTVKRNNFETSSLFRVVLVV